MKKFKIKNEKFKIRDKRNLFFAAILIILGIFFRTVWHLGPNVEFVTSAALLAGCYLGRKWAVLVPFLIMFVSDIFIGNTNIFIFTWSAYVIVGVGAYKVQNSKFKIQSCSAKFKVIRAARMGIVASVWFYLWTNFGVWLLDSWGMYERTLFGLLDAYIMGLPFLKYNLIGNLVLVPLSFFIVEVVELFGWNSIFSKILNEKDIKILSEIQ